MISDDAPDPRNGKIIQCLVLAPDPLGSVGRFVSGALARGTLSLCGWSPSPPPVSNFRRLSVQPTQARQILPLSLSLSLRYAALLSFSRSAFDLFSRRRPSSSSSMLLFYATTPRHCSRLYRVSREPWIVVRKYSKLLFLSPLLPLPSPPLSLCHIC